MRLFLKALWLVAASLTLACARVERIAADALISDSQEEQLGAQVKTELETKQGLKYVTNPVVVDYVKALVGKVTTPANEDREGLTWKVFVVNDPQTVNAFATPGGYIYVLSGLILAAENEAEIIGVAGHETGHVVGRHSARQLVSAYTLDTVISLALGNEPGLLSSLASQLAKTGAMLKNSRDHENEADEYGARYANAATYSPKGLATFFEKLQSSSTNPNPPQVLQWLSTHPDTGDRIDHIQRYIEENELTSTGTGDSAKLTNIKALLQSGN